MHLSRVAPRKQMPLVHATPPLASEVRRRLSWMSRLFAGVLCLLLLSEVLANTSTVAAHPQATPPPNPAQAVNTLQQFLAHAHPDTTHYTGPLKRSDDFSKLASQDPVAKPKPSAEPATMTPLQHTLTAFSSNTSPNAISTPLSLVGSDQRLEVQVYPASLNLAQAHRVGESTAITETSLTLQVSQVSGHYAGSANLLGTYSVAYLDSQKRAVQGTSLLRPITFVYHYTPAELSALGLDPGRMVMTWPSLIQAAQAKHTSTSAYVVPLTNDPVAHTLTAQSPPDAMGPMTLSGVTQVEQPPTAHLGSVAGNSGNLSYSYPLQVAPGSGGLAPALAFHYSSGAPNSRHTLQSPVGAVGEGWSLGLGSISAETYPDGTTWFFLDDGSKVSDRLVPDSSHIGFFFTEHISHLRIFGTNMSSTSSIPNCFQIWDGSGTEYSYGCTSDSLQYWTDSLGTQHTYRWDLNHVEAAHPSGTPNTHLDVSYFQDKVTSSGHTTVRDAEVAQITYGTLVGSTNTIVGSVDFHYLVPSIPSSVPSGTSVAWLQTYGGSTYTCSSSPPVSTTLRCDDPIDDGASKAPLVMSTYSLQQIISYVGPDTANQPAYRYDLSYTDSPFSAVTDPLSGASEYGFGEHLLTTITPTVYLQGSAHTRKAASFGYTAGTNYYHDSQQNGANGRPYNTYMSSQFLSSYVDQDTGIGGTVTYNRAYSNMHGTPYVTDGNGNIIDDRHDPFYCPNHLNDSDTSKRCAGSIYDYGEDHAWTVQAVTSITPLGTDSSAIGSPPTTNYTYALGTNGTWSGSGTWCAPAGTTPYLPGQTDCTYDTYIPGSSAGTDSDWQDFYHGEFRGFAKVYVTSPAGNLSVSTYYTTDAPGAWASYSRTYLSGSVKQEDVYWGNVESDDALIRETLYHYNGNNDNLPPGSTADSIACASSVPASNYQPCEAVVQMSRTTWYEANGRDSSAPWAQSNMVYDDYDPTNGLKAGYHNLLQETTTTSNGPSSIVKKWQYAITDTTINNWVYYIVNAVSHSEIDDSSGKVWQCQDTTYDQGAPSGSPSPSAGLATTVKAYSDCSNQSSTTLTSYSAYDAFGNGVGSVDSFGAAHSSLYSGNGCSLSATPSYLSPSWTAGKYTACTNYDTNHVLPLNQQNVYSQTSSITYSATQGDLPTSTTDITGQTTALGYNYDNNGNGIIRVAQPGEPGSYTTQSSTNSQCSTSSTLPCYEIDSSSSLYSGAVSRTFYDSLGRAVETRTPLDSSHHTIVFTVHDDANSQSFQSVPFRVPAGSSWIDPANATIDGGSTAPAGTTTLYDPLGRVRGVQDPALGSSAEPGITCGGLSGTWTSCSGQGLGSPLTDGNTYDYSTLHDANGHETVSFPDVLGRVRFVQTYSVPGSVGANITSVRETQYTVLNKPTAVIVTDEAPQTGQTITSVTTTATYDSLGRLTSVSDPDRGNHSYGYDQDSRLITDTSGSRTIGVSYDLLGRTRCVQDAAPTTDGSGNCSGGAHALVQNTYGTSYLQLSGTTDYATGRLTQSVATTYYPDGTSSVTTQQFEHDQRGRVNAANLHITVPSSWGVSTALPTYQETQSYNDLNQPMTTQTTVGGSAGYTYSLAYDSTTGTVTGLSNNTTGVANLVTESFDPHGMLSDLNFQTTTGTALADDHFSYDGDLRPAVSSATWLSGSGSSGTIFSSSRTYDPAGNVISTSTTQATVPGQSNSGGSETQNYCYDEENRLVWAGNSGTQPGAGNGTCGSGTLANTLNGAGYSSSYAYTHLGQIWQGPLNGTGATQQYLYCDSNHPHQLTGLYASGATCSTKTNPVYQASYDAWGNLTSRTYNGQTATLSYNVLDQLVQWNAGSNSQEWYVYDPSGERVLKRSITGSGTSLTVYAFGLEEHAYSATGTNTGNTYYYSLGGRLIGKFDGTNRQFYLTDALGSVLSSFSATAGSAAVLANQVYGPYGKQRYSKGNMGTSKGFTGQYNDTTGLDYYNARYYDAVVGRFVSADIVQGNLQGDDPYDYVGGNPETNSDPTGQRILGPNGSTAWTNPDGTTYVDVPKTYSYVGQNDCPIFWAGLYEKPAGDKQFTWVAPQGVSDQGADEKLTTAQKAQKILGDDCKNRNLCPDGVHLDLNQAEKDGGHTLKDHVTIKAADVITAIMTPYTKRYGTSYSLFLTQRTAQNAVYAAVALGTPSTIEPNDYLDPSGNMVTDGVVVTYNDVNVNFQTGIVYRYNRNTGVLESQVTTHVTVVIVLTATKCYVKVAYPEVDRGKGWNIVTNEQKLKILGSELNL